MTFKGVNIIYFGLVTTVLSCTVSNAAHIYGNNIKAVEVNFKVIYMGTSTYYLKYSIYHECIFVE
jgi:hypothetical protein